MELRHLRYFIAVAEEGSLSNVARPLQGESPAIDLMLGYNKSNTTPLLKRFLFRADEIVEHVSQKEILLSSKKRRIGAA